MVRLPAGVCLVLGLCLAACGANKNDVWDRAKAFSKTKKAGSAAVTLESVFFSDVPMSGTYQMQKDGTVRYSMSNDTFRMDMQQSGRDVWFVMQEAEAVHLTSKELTDTEYAQLRLLIGPFGIPLLSVPDLLGMLESKYVFVSARQNGFSGDDILSASPSPKFKTALKSWMALQTGADGYLLDLLTPDTVRLRISRKTGGIKEFEQVNVTGRVLSKLSMDFSDKSFPPPPDFQPPANDLIFGSREMMLALGTGTDWLKGKPVKFGNFQSLDGRPSSIADFVGRPMLVNFWATWCGPCRIEWPVIQQLFDKHGKNVSFLLLTDEPAQVVRSFVRANNYTAPVYLSQDRTSRQSFGVSGIPATYFVDSSGIIRHFFVGFPAKQTVEESRTALRDKYEAILAGLLRSSLRAAPLSGSDDGL